jgi:hypothetical protein
MASKTTQSANDVINYLLRNVAPSWGSNGTLYASLHTGAVGIGGSAVTNEADYVGYARIAITRSSGGGFTAASSASSSNNALLQFGNCTGGTLPQTITNVSLVDTASGAGVAIATAALASSLVVNINIQPQFAIGTLVVTEA